MPHISPFGVRNAYPMILRCQLDMFLHQILPGCRCIQEAWASDLRPLWTFCPYAVCVIFTFEQCSLLLVYMVMMVVRIEASTLIIHDVWCMCFASVADVTIMLQTAVMKNTATQTQNETATLFRGMVERDETTVQASWMVHSCVYHAWMMNRQWTASPMSTP